MNKLQNEIKVQFIAPDHWYSRAKWRLLEDYVSQNGDVIVHKGFVSDGASIPFFLRWAFSSTGKYFGAAIVHDYLIVEEGDWGKANDEFNNEIKALGVSDFRRRLMVSAVRVYRELFK